MGTCQSHPPMYIGDDNGGNPWQWAKVHPTDFCGQHLGKEQAELSPETKASRERAEVRAAEVLKSIEERNESTKSIYEEYDKRNLLMYAAIKAGRTYRDVASQWGISASRVSTIVHKMDRKKRHDSQKRKTEEPSSSIYVTYSAFNINKEGYEFLMTAIEDVEFSVRTKNCLLNEGIKYVWQIFGKTEAELLRAPSFGRKSLNELKEVLAAYKFNLMDVLSESLLWHLDKGIAYGRIGGFSQSWHKD